jgi:hypothetical protein
VKKTQQILIYLVLSVPILSLVTSITAVKAVGDDYCFASSYKELGFLGSFTFWFFDWVPTMSFFPIHISMLIGQGGTGSFAVHSIIHFVMNSFLLYLLVSLISDLSFKKKIMYTLFSWNIAIIFLGTVSPLSSKIWYATHWGLTTGRFTSAILGLLLFGVLLKNRNWIIVITLSFWMSQLSAPEVLAWVAAIFAYFIYKKKCLTLEVKQKLLASALIQLTFSSGTVLYTKLIITDRSDSFSGSQESRDIFFFLTSFARLLFYQIVDTNSLLNITFCFFISLTLFGYFGTKIELLLRKEVLTVIIFPTFSSYLIIPAADAYAYGAPWHNLQIIVLSSTLKTVLFYRILCRMASKRDLPLNPGIRNMSFLSLSLLSLFLSLSLLLPNLERMGDWENRWLGGAVDSSLIPKTFQNQPLQGDVESKWIKDCYRKWRY